jgi:PAS domain-containing protein
VSGSVPIGVTRLTPDVELLFRRATDALDDSFAIIRALRDSNGAVIDFVVEHVNDAACRSTGRRREAQVGRTLGSMDPEYLRSELFDWHLHALEAGAPSALDEVVYERTETGRRLREASEVRAAPVGAGRLAVSWHDITEHKRAERELSPSGEALDALELSELRFRAAVSGAPMVLFTMDRDLRYTWVFSSQSGIYGDEAPLGKTDEEIFGRDVGRTLTHINREALAGESVVREVDLDLPNGPATFELTAQPLRDQSGEVIGVAGTAYELALDGRDGRSSGARRWGLPVRG